MALTREEQIKKIRVYEDRLAPRDFARSNKLDWYSTCSVAAAIVSAFLVAAGVKVFPPLILIGFCGATLSIGCWLIFTAKTALIRKYISLGDQRMGSLYIFDDAAIKTAKTYLVVGYLVIGLGILWSMVSLLILWRG